LPTAAFPPRWALVPLLVLAWGAPDVAWGYCRQTTCDREDCPVDSQGCIALGDELYYDVPCLSFGFDAGSAEPLGLSDDEMLELIGQAFQSWKEVECPDGGQPSFEVQPVGVVEASGIFFCEEEETNVSVWTLDQTWNYEASSLGYTTSTFVVDDGEVYDADVELNLRRIASIVPSNGDVARAVLSVATHEAGHFLGLAHSDDFGAVMAATYADLAPRPLTEDDIAGICAIYPPRRADLSCSAPGVSEAGYDREACAVVTESESDADGACSVARNRHGDGAWYATLIVGAAFCGLRRRGKWLG
jgi:hypothetical protein